MVGLQEFMKPVYKSTFTKRAEGMSFVKFKREPNCPKKYYTAAS
jgi:hypothetical protein